uniref:Uncharacterized protein n=1 Tax=Rhodnius prolixus TaxID=13249 RepID=A0A4P6DA61_RHOPR
MWPLNNKTIDVNSSPATLDLDDQHVDESSEELINKITEQPQTYGLSLLKHPSKLLRCYQQAVKQLEKLRFDSVHELATCSRLKELNETAENFPLMDMDPKIMYTLTDSLLHCTRRDEFSELLCVTKAFLAFSNSLSSIIPEFEAYEPEVLIIGREVRDIFQYCAHRRDYLFKLRLAKILKQRNLCL